jgi:hypothetical protein
LSLPVEFLARDGQLFAHSLENLVLRVIQCVLDDGLVGSLVLVDGGHDDGGVGGLQVHVLILAHKVELDVASLPVVIIDLDDAVQLLVLDVDGHLDCHSPVQKWFSFRLMHEMSTCRWPAWLKHSEAREASFL